MWWVTHRESWIWVKKQNFTEFSQIQTWGQSQASRSLILNIISHLFVHYFHAKCALRNGVILIVIGNNFHAFHPFVHYCNDSEINMHDERTSRIGQSWSFFWSMRNIIVYKWLKFCKNETKIGLKWLFGSQMKSKIKITSCSKMILSIHNKLLKNKFSSKMTSWLKKVKRGRHVEFDLITWNKLKFWPLNGQAPVVWLQMGPILPTGWQLHSESIFTKREIFLDQKMS